MLSTASISLPARGFSLLSQTVLGGELQFEQTDDPYQWVLPTGKLELVHIEGIYVATVQFTGSRWVIIDED